jgi:UDP:flavonoid glycosyltransferase YjiC (YdhE family)
VPQVVLDFDIEKLLIGRALSQRGVARRFDYRSASPEEIHAGIRAALADHPMLIAAEKAAREHAAYRERDVIGEIAERCERLVA